MGAVTGTLATANTEVYVALRNTSTTQQNYSFYIQDNTGNWYKGRKNATLANGKYYTATVSMTKLSELTSSTEGTVGVIDGLPAIVISGNKAVALMNVGALCPEHYGKYYTFANLSSLGLPTGWHVPSKDEFDVLVGKTNTWGAPNGVSGSTFTIGSEKLFLPAAGFYDNNSTPTLINATWGYYWSSTSTTTEGSVYSLQFKGVITSLSFNSSKETDGLSVRPFHSLP